MPPRKGTERPTAYSDELAEHILGQLSEGVFLRAICRPAAMPTHGTVYRWKRGLHGAPEDFAERLQAARDAGSEALKDEMLDIVDKCPADRDAVAKAKLQVYVREKALANWTQGKVQVEHSGAVGIRWAATEAEAVADISRQHTDETDSDDDDDSLP